MDDFDEFWSHYPKKFNKGVARKAWLQTESIRPPLEELLQALETAKRSVEWHRADRDGRIGAFIPYPASWLRAEGWANDYKLTLPSIRTPSPLTSPVNPEPVTDRVKGLANVLAIRQKLNI